VAGQPQYGSKSQIRPWYDRLSCLVLSSGHTRQIAAHDQDLARGIAESKWERGNTGNGKDYRSRRRVWNLRPAPFTSTIARSALVS
jgi:hypothetical protein